MPPGHVRRIVLWRPKSTASSDAAGIEVTDVKSAPKEYFQPGPYVTPHDQRPAARSTGVPSLQLICLTKARELLDLREDWREVLTDALPAWRDHAATYESVVKSRSIQQLLPGVDSDPTSVTPLKRVDPLTWALVIQLVAKMPSRFRCYDIALSDAHLPLLQHIPDSTHFCLITILDLQGCSHLTDDTISNLKDLHGLVALNASNCMGLSTTAITRLRNALVRDDNSEETVTRRGPWRLRLLWLRGCKLLNSNIFAELEKFPLLSVVDLTATGCYNRGNTAFQVAAVAQLKLYHPAHLLDATYALACAKGVTPSQNMFALYIDKLHPDVDRTRRPHRPAVNEEDGFVILSKTAIRHGRLQPESTERKPLQSGHQARGNNRRAHDEIIDPWHSCMDEPLFGHSENSDSEDADSKDESDVDEDDGEAFLDPEQIAERFYGTLLPQADVDSLFLRRMAALPPREQPATSPEQRLNPLMLYRKPPPYTAIVKQPSRGTHATSSSMHRSKFEVVAAPANRALPHVKAALESLGKVHKQLARKQVAVTVRPADGFGMPSSSNSKAPRNPFLARSRRPMPDFGTTSTPSSSTSSPRVVPSDFSATTGAPNREENRPVRTSSANMAKNSTMPALTPPSPDSESRPLRGISALAVPPPPPTTKKRQRTSVNAPPAKKAKATTLDPALAVGSLPKSKGLRPTNSAALRQKMEQQKRAEEDREEMLASEKKERRKSTGSIKASSSSRPRERTSTAGGKLDNWFKRS